MRETKRTLLPLLAPLLLATAGAGTVLAQHQATPTTPPSGSVDGDGPTAVTFTAANRAGAATGSSDCLGLNCSSFLVTVHDPGDKALRVRLDWGLVSNDYDLEVFDDGGNGQQVAASGNGTTTFEETAFTPVDGETYEVLIVHFAAAPGDEITGVVELVDVGVVEPARIGPSGTGIVFSPNGITATAAGPAPSGKGTLAAPEAARDGEPSIRVDQLGNVYPAGIRGVPAGVDVWRFGPDAYCPRFEFHDDEEVAAGFDPASGYTWLGQPDGIFVTDGEGSPDAGGGDIEIAVNGKAGATLADPPNLSMVSLTLANITSAASADRGDTWTPANPAAATVPLDDRQWINAFGEKTVYLYYRTLATLTGLVLNKSIDGGVTYAAATTLVNPLGLTPGFIAVDPNPNWDASVNIYLSAVSASQLVVYRCVDPTPAFVNVPLINQITCTPSTVDATMSHGHIFDPVAVDGAGNVYAAWSNNGDVFYAWSGNHGASWSPPVQVTDAAEKSMPSFNFFPWITAGDEGRIGIVWYGTFDATTNADDDSEWKAYYAYVGDATAATPTVRWLPASDHYVHKGNVSQGGFDPNDTSLNRNLIDFFQVGHDPRDGAAVIAYAADYNDFDGHTHYTRQIGGPGLVASASPTAPSCPPLEPLRNPEVTDFADDVATASDTGLPAADADLLAIDYGWQQEGSALFLTADVKVADFLVQPLSRSYRAYFAVNAERGLMEAGQQYFIEATTENVTPEYWLGVLDRGSDGIYAEQRVERIDADQAAAPFVLGTPGLVRLRVDVGRLHYGFAAAGTPTPGASAPPALGDLVIGLRGRSRLVAAGVTSVLDETRGGSYVTLGEGACTTVDFEALGSHGSAVSSFALGGATIAVGVIPGGPHSSSTAALYDTDTVGGPDPDLEWDGGGAECAACEGRGNVLVIADRRGFASHGNASSGGALVLTGFPAGAFGLTSVTVLDSDRAPFTVRVDGAVKAASERQRNGDVQVLGVDANVVQGEVRIDFGKDSGGVDDLTFCVASGG
jgi:hypothetical protein